MKPLCIDLFAGLGGWSDGFLGEGWDCIGFDIERHAYGERCYPGQLVLQDVLTLDGAQFKNAHCIVASPPCQEFSYFAMPWSRAKQIARALRGRDYFPDEYTGSWTLEDLTALFDACFRIQWEASEAAGHHIPMVVENVNGAQPWVGKARANFGSFYLWGDVDSIGGRIVKRGAGWGAASVKAAGRGAKVPGMNWSGSDQPGYVAVAFNDEAARRLREGQKVPGFNFHEHEKTGQPGRSFQSAAVDGQKTNGHVNKEQRRHNSKSDSRKAASAQIAKIPFALASHIARIFRPSGAGRQNETAAEAPNEVYPRSEN